MAGARRRHKLCLFSAMDRMTIHCNPIVQCQLPQPQREDRLEDGDFKIYSHEARLDTLKCILTRPSVAETVCHPIFFLVLLIYKYNIFLYNFFITEIVILYTQLKRLSGLLYTGVFITS